MIQSEFHLRKNERLNHFLNGMRSAIYYNLEHVLKQHDRADAYAIIAYGAATWQQYKKSQNSARSVARHIIYFLKKI